MCWRLGRVRFRTGHNRNIIPPLLLQIQKNTGKSWLLETAIFEGGCFLYSCSNNCSNSCTNTAEQPNSPTLVEASADEVRKIWDLWDLCRSAPTRCRPAFSKSRPAPTRSVKSGIFTRSGAGPPVAGRGQPRRGPKNYPLRCKALAARSPDYPHQSGYPLPTPPHGP